MALSYLSGKGEQWKNFDDFKGLAKTNPLPVSGGLLGLSGILASQAESVCEAYADSFALDPVVEKEEWCRITGRKN